jgi:hypothetical protein
MSEERIAVVGASPVPVTTTTSQAHSMSDGSFLDAVQVASSTKVLSTPPVPVAPVTQVAPESKEVPHPFYEDETWVPNEESGFFGEDGFDLGDLLDVINPLQHIPVISSIYRSLTGDEISPGARLAGGTLYGGPVGLVSAFVSGVVEDTTDTTLGDIVVAAFTNEDETEIAAQVASISPAAGIPTSTPIPANAMAAPMPIPVSEIVAQTNLPAQTSRPPASFDPIAAALGQPQSAPSPLAFAREIVESPRSGLAAPSSAATKSIIAADEMMRNQPEIPDSVSAVLAARSQVPRGGAVGGLSTYRRSPVMTESVDKQELGQIPQTASFSAHPITPPTPATSRNGDAVPVPGKRGVPPLRANIAANASPRRRAATSTPVPSSMVPKAMMSALDKYESMVQQRQKPDADLTM